MAIDTRIVSVKKVIINSIPIITNGKCKVKLGAPTNTVKTGIGGKNICIPVVIQDWTQVISEATIPIFWSVHNTTNFRKWQFPPYIGFNAIYMIDEDTGIAFYFKQMTITEDIEWDSQAKEPEVVFQGAWVRTEATAA